MSGRFPKREKIMDKREIYIEILYWALLILEIFKLMVCFKKLWINPAI